MARLYPPLAQEAGRHGLMVWYLTCIAGGESMDIHATNGKDYEVKVNARNGKVIAIIVGG
jgi:hypothetical protein